MTYNKNAPWLDRSLKLNLLFDPLLTNIATNIAEKKGKRIREDGIKNIKTALSVIFANLLRQSALAPSLGLLIDRSNDGYLENIFNPHRLGIRSVRKVVDYLLTSNPPLIEKRGGNIDRQRNVSYPTEIRSVDRIIKLILDHLNDRNGLGNFNELLLLPITRNTFGIDEYVTYGSALFEKANLPIIRLRDTSSKKGGKLVDFERTSETDHMEERLASYNSFLASHGPLNLFATDREMQELLSKPNESLDEFGNIDSDNRLIDLVSGNKLYRVFNDGRFDHGGRFYGGWWQNIPSSHRHLITINGQPTIEVDFSGVQLAMLYAKVGQQLEDDPYIIEGIDPKFRSLVKTATLKLINAHGRIEKPRESALPEGVSWGDLQQAIIARHKPIADFFHSGEGIRLQRLDADIAEDVILRMMEKGILALPIHDSFIVTEGHAGLLETMMTDAYQRKMEGYTIRTKRSHSLFDELLAGKDDLSENERYDLGMELFQAEKERPEYQGYRLREEWLNPRASVLNKKDNSKRVGAEPYIGSEKDISASGPRVETPNSGMITHPNPAKRLWDRFMKRREAA